MIDRELLELAARAAGIGLFDDEHGETWRVYYTDPNNGLKRYTRWNPLTDDGDALRLAVKLFMFVDSAAGAPDSFGAELVRAGNEVVDKTEPRTHNDPYAATRRAIVRAAAEIGRSVK